MEDNTNIIVGIVLIGFILILIGLYKLYSLYLRQKVNNQTGILHFLGTTKFYNQIILISFGLYLIFMVLNYTKLLRADIFILGILLIVQTPFELLDIKKENIDFEESHWPRYMRIVISLIPIASQIGKLLLGIICVLIAIYGSF